ncbi:glycoside hydrolase family 43 protein [Sphingobacterium faecium]|uniref:glycoside hydrolase family 43 protein n=1 Tax=Sphingobacterium faecium TaxID=34087 RepID=UPI0032078F58
MKKIFLIPILLFLGFCAKGQSSVYLFSYFIDNGADGLHLAYSFDGLKWEQLNQGKSFLKPMIGKDKLMRDPSICLGADGRFHLVWTTGWWDKSIGYSSSKNLIQWAEQKAIPVMEEEPDAKNAWAPEVFYDQVDQQYYIIWSSTISGRHKEVNTSASEKGLNHRIYSVTTPDFTIFSKASLFFNPDFSVIDAAIMKKNNNEYLMVLKNENSNPPEKNIRFTVSNDLKQGFPVKVSQPITGNYWAEGPAPLQIGEYTYVYFDKYRDHRYGAVRSKDGLNWEDVSDQISFPKGVRHGTAFKVDQSILDHLLKVMK